MAPHQLAWRQVIPPRAAGLSKDQNGWPVGSGTAEEWLTAYSRWGIPSQELSTSPLFFVLKNKNTSSGRFCALTKQNSCQMLGGYSTIK